MLEYGKLMQLHSDAPLPEVAVGDTVRVHVKVVEGGRERSQVFEGLVIRRHRPKQPDGTFTVRRISHGVGVERTFMMSSPRIEKVEVVRRGRVRRAKLYYLRNLTGKAARIKERRPRAGAAPAPSGAAETPESASEE